MDLKIDEFKQIFFGELDKKLLPLGFKYVKSQHGYILKKENWHFRFLVDCTKWTHSISVQTKISARNLIVEKTFNELCGTKYEGLKIWGVYPTIADFLEQQYADTEKPEQFLCIYSKGDILKTAGIWLNYFENTGLPFIDKIITDKNFSFQLVLKGRYVLVYDRYRYLPIMCKQFGMNNEEIEAICIELEKGIDEINENCPFSDEFKEKWVNEYYTVKDAVLNEKMPIRRDVSGTVRATQRTTKQKIEC